MPIKIAFFFFGGLFGLIIGVTTMSFVVMSPSLTDQKTLSDISNFVVALGAVFTLGFTLWQHQQTLSRDERASYPRVGLVGAPISQLPPLRPGMSRVAVELQFRNDGKNPASKLRLRTFVGPMSSPQTMAQIKDETIANPIFGGNGFHWVVPAEFASSINAKDNEYFWYLRMDYFDSNEDGGEIRSEYFMKMNYQELAMANATLKEVEVFRTRIKELAV